MTSPDAAHPEIDFVAYHDLQAQCGLSAFEHLSKIVPCRWRIGPHSTPSPRATGAVMLDHSVFQHHVHKASGGYQNLFHICHDLGDINFYVDEFSLLSHYDIIFTPTSIHSAAARKAYQRVAGVEIVETGWPKYDLMDSAADRALFTDRLASLPAPVTILYAPTYAKHYEWKDLYPILLNYPDINLVIKNHIYVNPGQPFPSGLEEVYACELQSADEMEKIIQAIGSDRLVVAPRGLNICSLFPRIDLLISDSSSVLAEFLPFGNSIETGRCGPALGDNKPEMSKLYTDIAYMPTAALGDMLSQRRLDELLKLPPSGHRDAYRMRSPDAGRRIAQEIARKIGV